MKMSLPKRYVEGLTVIEETLGGEQTVDLSRRSIPEESKLISPKEMKRV